MSDSNNDTATSITPIIPVNAGQLFFDEPKDLLLCKPRLMPLKSLTLEKLEKMQQTAAASTKQEAEVEK